MEWRGLLADFWGSFSERTGKMMGETSVRQASPSHSVAAFWV